MAQLTDELILRLAVGCIRKHVPIVINGLKVIVQRGHVTLEGRVSLAFLRSRAEKFVRELPGVAGLTNQIVVTPLNAVDTEPKKSAQSQTTSATAGTSTSLRTNRPADETASDRWPRIRSDRPRQKVETRRRSRE